MIPNAVPGPAPNASVARFGVNAKGETVYAVRLINRRGMQVVILTRGGAIAEIRVPDRAGKYTNVVLTRPDFAAWDRGGAFNTLVGRFANRIAGGGFSLDGQRFALQANPAGITLHGGHGGWGTRLWTAQTFAGKGAAGVHLSLNSPDGDNGFPGEVLAKATYTLNEGNELRLDWQAVTSKPTHINLTNHTYFNLAGHGSAPIDGHWLRLFASHYTPTAPNQIPTGEIATVADTPFDFSSLHAIGPALRSNHPQILLARGIDHNLVVDGIPGSLRPAAELIDPISGRRLLISSTEPGIQLYSANHFNGSQRAGEGRLLRRGDGIALETQHFPDSPNRPEFPSTVLRPGEIFTSTTIYTFGIAG